MSFLTLNGGHGANSASPNPLAVFEGHFEVWEREGKGKGGGEVERKERDERDGR